MSYLLPTKHSHLDKTIFAAAIIITKRLKKQRVAQYDDLLSHLKEKNKDGEYFFLPAINLLYLLGLVDYHSKNDMLEYVGR